MTHGRGWTSAFALGAVVGIGLACTGGGGDAGISLDLGPRATKLQACGDEDWIACTELGDDYANGLSGPVDHASARGAFERGCSGGNTIACVRLGILWEDGLGGASDLAEATRLYRQACDGGHEHGCHNAALLIADGAGGLTVEARDLELAACERDVEDACAALGFAYATGSGLDKDVPTGVDFLVKACDLGHATSCLPASQGVAARTAGRPHHGRAPELKKRGCDLGDPKACD